MDQKTSTPKPVGRLGRVGQQLVRDFIYVVPGFPLAALSFSILVSFTLVSVGTAILWLGVLGMPVTLLLASRFAALSRARVSWWKQKEVTADYQPRAKGMAGLIRVMKDPRRWLDLIFEAVIALPLRFTTFFITIILTALALEGLTQWAWRSLLVDHGYSSTARRLLAQIGFTSEQVNTFETPAAIAIGLLFLACLFPVMRGLAFLDGVLTEGLLSSRSVEQEPTGRGGRVQRLVQNAPWFWVTTLFAAVPIFINCWVILGVDFSFPFLVAMVLALAQAVALIGSVRWPGRSAALFFVSAVLVQIISFPTRLVHPPWKESLPWPWPTPSVLLFIGIVLVASLRFHWLIVARIWIVGAVFTVAALIIGQPLGIANGVVSLAVTAGVGSFGLLIRAAVLNLRRAQAVEKVNHEETQRRQHLQERNRIARELHDVVAHSLSVITVQAETAKYRRPEVPAEVEQEFVEIAVASRRALGEMRSLLAILRGSDDAPTRPVPTLNDIEDLIETTRASGVSINYEGHEDEFDTELSPAVGLTVYRVVQEALSNALRHAPGSEVTVSISLSEDKEILELTVHNCAPTEKHVPTSVPGTGLKGLEERVLLLGGSFAAQPTANGGFEVGAQIPLQK